MQIIKCVILFLICQLIMAPIYTAQQKTCTASRQKIEFYYYTVQKTDTAEKLFGDYWIDVLRFNRIDRNHFCAGKKVKVPLKLEDVKNFSPLPDFYEPAKIYEKYVLISLGDQFLGCYEYGQLKLSFPIASGKQGHNTPMGDFRVLAKHRDHSSSLYKIEGTSTPYPMHWAINFKISSSGVAFWIHSRDMPGYPASHGCIGLYDEEMQKKYYGKPQNPILEDAKILYLWLFPGTEGDGKLRIIDNGAPIRIVEKID